MVRSSQGAAAYRDPRFAARITGISTPMSGSLVFLPLRLGLRATGLAVRGAREIVERVAGLAGLAPEHAPSPDFDAAPAAPPTRTEPPVRPTQTQTAGAPAVNQDEAIDSESPPVNQGETIDYDAPAEPVPGHVDEGSELVEEVAEPGAEDGAGAQVHVAEPWDGYDVLRADDVIERVGQASAEELAAIELYELTSRKRQTVIAAAQRELARRR
jgi:hypothetical protein